MKISFSQRTFVILCFIQIYVQHTGAYDVNLSNLGNFITSQVQNHVNSITSKVNEEVTNINQNIHREMNDFSQNLRRRMDTISENVETQIQGLTAKIHANVENSMKPVHAMMITSAMAHGVGGTTVAVYGAKTRLLIINNNKYMCPGNLVKTKAGSVQCSERLVPDIDDNNICTESSYSRLNNIYCFGNHASLQCLDNSCQCKNGNMYTINAMKNACGESFGTDDYVHYTYYPDVEDPNHIAIPNPNEYVKCTDANSGACTWSGNGFVVPIKDL